MASEELFPEEVSEDILDGVDLGFGAEEVIGEEEKEGDDTITNELVESLETEANELNHLVKFRDPAPGIESQDATEAEVSSESRKVKEVNTNDKDEPAPGKLVQLPLNRVKNLMKLDADLQMASNEAVFLVTKATELFVESLARESYTFTAQAKKKCVQKRDVDLAIDAVDSLMFLEGCMN